MFDFAEKLVYSSKRGYLNSFGISYGLPEEMKFILKVKKKD
jgi:hypothetical protein